MHVFVLKIVQFDSNIDFSLPAYTFSILFGTLFTIHKSKLHHASASENIEHHFMFNFLYP